jgi:RimJ/RimL family protein N-acetyltransferase
LSAVLLCLLKAENFIATCILVCVEKFAKLDEKRLELSFLKNNTPEQNLYEKLGFAVEQEKKWSLVLRRKV